MMTLDKLLNWSEAWIVDIFCFIVLCNKDFKYTLNISIAIFSTGDVKSKLCFSGQNSS